MVPSYIELLTDFDLKTLNFKDPRELQRFMAVEVTALIHGRNAALKAQSNAEKIFLGQKDNVGDIPEISLRNSTFPIKLFYLLSSLELYKSSSESKRSIKGGGVKIDSQKITNPDIIFETKEELLGKILQVGKKITKRFEN